MAEETRKMLNQLSKLRLATNLQNAEREKIIDALLASETRLANVLNIAHEAIISIDAEQKILMFNKGAETIFGYSAEDVIGQQLDILLPEDAVAAHKHHIEIFSDSPEKSRMMSERGQIHGRRKDGSIFPAEASISKLDNPLMFTVVLRDITARIEAQRERENFIQQLRALDDATRAITTQLSLEEVLQTIANTAQSLMDVHIAALGVQEAGEYFSQFITAGITPAVAEAFETSFFGRKLLGPLLFKGEPILLNRIFTPSGETGLPAEFPPLKNLMGVPISLKGNLIGAMYLANKKHGTPFTQTDRLILQRLAAHAAIAIENARAYEQTQRLAILEERERFARDLHDGIIQSIYAVGLMLDQAKADIPAEYEPAKQQIQGTLDNLARVIQDIRNYIFDLRPQAIKDKGLKNRLDGLIREVSANTQIPIRAVIPANITAHLSDEQADHLFHICHEALSNAVRHAAPSHITVAIRREKSTVTLTVTDDGIGFVMPSNVKPGHRGLANMRSRAFHCGARMEIQSIPNKGTSVTVQIKERL